jgi:hypothetical protein
MLPLFLCFKHCSGKESQILASKAAEICKYLVGAKEILRWSYSGTGGTSVDQRPLTFNNPPLALITRSQP